MAKVFRFEIKRLFFSKSYLVSAIIGVLIAIIHVVTTVIPQSQYLDAYLQNSFLLPHSVYGKAIGLDPAIPFTMILYLSLPIIAAIPYASSYSQDVRKGYARFILVRCNRRDYLLSKSIVLFISGTTLTFIPLVTDFFLTSLFLPALVPQAVTRLFPITDRCFLAQMFYSYPGLYCLIYFLIGSAIIGFLLQISLLVSNIFATKVEITLMPFLVYLMLYFLSTATGITRIAPIAWILPFQPAQYNKIYIPMLIFSIFIILSVWFLFHGKGKKNDVY